MDADNRIYENIQRKQDTSTTQDKESYELLRVDTREAKNEYEQVQVNVTALKQSIVQTDNSMPNGSNNNGNAKKKTKRYLVIPILLMLFMITVVAIVLSVISLTGAHGRSLQAQIQSMGQSESAENTSAKLQLTDQLKVTQSSVRELRNEINLLTTQLNDLRNDFNLLNTQLNNLSSSIHTRINEVELAGMNLRQEFESLQSKLGYKRINQCGSGLWKPVANLNMSDPSQQCPPVWREYSANGVRACGRPLSATCYSMVYSNVISFTKVCGQVIGYQIGSTDAFSSQPHDINAAYVDGVSITYGGSRRHIWTYAAGISEIIISGTQGYCCPCLALNTSFTTPMPPNFVGNNYYCESGNPSSGFENTNTFRYTDDPLWDGQNCEGQCCSDGRAPPWFSVQLPNATTSNIEVRICGQSPSFNDDTPIELLEIYVQ